MKVRELPPDEWWRVGSETPFPVFPEVPPESMCVVVVEEDGEILASLTVLRATHLEGLWVSPKGKNAGVVRGLLRGAGEVAERWGSGWAFGTAADEQMTEVMKRIGAQKVPVDSYVVTLGGEHAV